MRSIKTQYILTCAKVTGISIVALITMSISSAILHSHASDVTKKQLPFTLEVNKLSARVTSTLNSLNSWVLYADESKIDERRDTWQKDVFPTFNTVKERMLDSGHEEQQAQIVELGNDLDALYTSQWWVEDAARYVGNQPSLVIYQRDLLPIYFHIQSALSGITDSRGDDDAANFLKLIVSNTHLLLSETIHQISEVILTGETAHLNRFRRSAEEVREHIQLLQGQDSLTSDAAALVDWLDRQYGVYVKLANEVTESRQASDWNRSMYIMTQETKVLSERVKQRLLEIQNAHIVKLEADTQRTEDAAFSAATLAIILLLIAMATSIYLTGGNARRIVRQILELKVAANDLAHGRQNQIEIVYDNELGQLAKVFNQMQRIILRRRKRYVSERERLSEVVRIITHDIKSPLINIVGHSKVVQNNVAGVAEGKAKFPEVLPEIQSSLKYTVLATSRIDELINGILEFSSISHKEFKLEHVSLLDVIDEMLQVNSASLKGVEVNIGKMPTEVVTDLFSFKFILSTILCNAVKYRSEERALKVSINALKDEVGKHWIFSIADNGIGIDENNSEAVFKMFSKINNDTEGFGIGLSCVKSLVNRLDGDIYFRNNEDNQGVTFYVSFPIYPDANMLQL